MFASCLPGRLSRALIMIVALTAFPAFAQDLQVGEPAPTFEAPSADGNEFSLEAQKGKMVVLEWTNNECPFVRKHYNSGNMQKLQQFADNNGMVWVSIISSAKGKQGHVTPEQAMKNSEDNYASLDYIILDEDGKIGRLYGAKTTPHMFLIDPEGKLIYNGAIDSINSVDQDDIERAEKYFYDAMTAAKKGETIDIKQSKPYGCAIKY